jgi:hypothetical protein
VALLWDLPEKRRDGKVAMWVLASEDGRSETTY